MIDLTDRVALVTGANRGIGLAIARTLAQSGARVAYAARSQRAAAAVVDGRGIAVTCDVTDYESVNRAVAACVQQLGVLDILVNNAGVIDPISRIADSDPAAWAHTVDVNYKGVYFGMRAAIPVMEQQGGGVIVNMSSGAANSALEGWSHYCSAKAAAKRLTECGHKEYGERGIRVVGLSPGTVATDMMRQIKHSGINPVSQLDWSVHIPPEWVGQAVAFLCGPEGAEFAGTDFSLKTPEGRRRVGLPQEGAPDG